MDPHNLPNISHFRQSTPLQIRFNDVDVLGHVNNTVYFSFFDTGKATYMGAVEGHPVDWKHVDTVIANIDCAFIAPTFFGENVEVLTACTALHEKSYELLQVIREHSTGQIKAVSKTVMVCFDPATGKSREMSEELRNKIEAFEGRDLYVPHHPQ